MTLFFFSFESVTGLPGFVGYIFLFVLGTTIGSFLNVVIHRVPRQESIVFPSSKCPECKTPIRPYDNIPLLGWLLLRGKCRTCRAPIAWRYPAVELLTGLLWLVAFWQIGFTPFLVVALTFVTVTIALMFIDAEHMILPNVITYPFFLFVIAARIVFAVVFGYQYFPDLDFAPLYTLSGTYPAWLVSLAGAGLGALAGGGSLWLVGEAWKRLRGVDAMGLGDVKMMFGVGALLGWRLTFLSIFIGAFAGALVGVGVMIKQKDRGLQTQIPFGIFLGIGSVAALFFGEQIISWYVSSFIP